MPSRDGEVLVRAAEIDWVEAQGNYVALHVRGQERLLRQPLKEIENRDSAPLSASRRAEMVKALAAG